MKWISLMLSITCIAAANASDNAGDWVNLRARMVNAINDHTRDTGRLTGIGVLSQQVQAALNNVPRHRFVPLTARRFAYEDRPLPIGDGQTISQPFIVALMTELLDVDATSKVLEIGTGSGYQAAILSEIVAEVFTIEIIRNLGEQAATTLRQLGYDNVQTRIGDGFLGWPSQAPFDGIIVTAAGIDIPPPLLDQLKPGGKMVLPVGPQNSYQTLKVIQKSMQGEIRQQDVLSVRFVPLTRSR